jgi:uncharacterized C2H2 Zn-finger protein
MKCPNCKHSIIPLRLGATIGGTRLLGCPVCGAVFIELNKNGERE